MFSGLNTLGLLEREIGRVICSDIVTYAKKVVCNIIEVKLSADLNQGIKHNCSLWVSNKEIHLMPFLKKSVANQGPSIIGTFDGLNPKTHQTMHTSRKLLNWTLITIQIILKVN